MDCGNAQLELFDHGVDGRQAPATDPSAHAVRVWLVTAHPIDAKRIEVALGRDESTGPSLFLSVSDGRRIVEDGDVVLLKTPGSVEISLFVPRHFDRETAAAAVAAIEGARLLRVPTARAAPEHLMFATFRGAPDRSSERGGHRSILEGLLCKLRTAPVRSNAAAVRRLCEDALALARPAGSPVIASAIERMWASSRLASSMPPELPEAAQECARVAARLRGGGRGHAADRLLRLAWRTTKVHQLELFVRPEAAENIRATSLGAVIRKCTALALVIDLPPAVPRTAAGTSTRDGLRASGSVRVPRERLVSWARDCESDILVPSVTIVERAGAVPAMVVALSSEFAFLLDASPRSGRTGPRSEWTVMPHSPARRFHPETMSVGSGSAATFTLDRGARRISRLYLTLSRPGWPMRTVRIPFSHQRVRR